MKLKDKVCFVSGGSRGIGKSIVENLCDEGAHVYFSYVRTKENAIELEESLIKKGLKCTSVHMEVTERIL